MQQQVITQYFEQVQRNVASLGQCQQDIITAANLMQKALQAGGTIFFAGNGGSAADCQHLAAELVGRYKKERASLPAIALTTDTSALTAIGNDYGFEHIFARQLAGLGKEGDILIAISTSGKSANVIKAIEVAHTKNIKVIGLSGQNAANFKNICDVLIACPSLETNHIQEMHIMVGHLLCAMVEDSL